MWVAWQKGSKPMLDDSSRSREQDRACGTEQMLSDAVRVV